MKRILLVFLVAAQALQMGCEEGAPPPSDLSVARRGHTMVLRSRAPAPQAYENATPPVGVEEVLYHSGDLQLKAWLSVDPGDKSKRPAVVFLHGGWAFAPVDWQDAAPFVEAGFVVLIPTLRGENGNPGDYESFYGEVDDAIAAGRFVAGLSYVDDTQVFVAGHSVGAMLAVLTAMMPSNYQGAAALSGYLDMESWVVGEAAERVVFDPLNREEVRLRNPMEFAASLRIPLILFAERGWAEEVNEYFAARASRAGKPCDLVIVDGDHMTMVYPSVKQSIVWFRERMAE